MGKLYIPTEGDQCYDLSDHQGALSVEYFKSLKKKGVTCVILRSSYTKVARFELHVDAHFHNNIRNAIAAGMHIGIYHYSSAIKEEESPKEAAFCLKTIKEYKKSIDLPVGFDCEFGPSHLDPRFTSAVAKKLGKKKLGKIAKGFMEAVRDAGYEPMLYANLSMFTNYLPAKIHKKYKVWVAQYNVKCQYDHPYYMWQYTSTNGKLDKNRFGHQDTKQKPTSILPDRGYFKLGDRGENVKEIKKLLNTANAGSHWKLPITDEYDKKTVKYVKLLEDARHITIDGQFGSVCLKECKKTVTIQRKIANRGVAVARDDKYAYGVGDRAHRYGDPFSGTNTGPRLKKKEKAGEPHVVNAKGAKWKDGDGEKHTYENTMCCNPFVTMCYGYGGEIQTILKALRAGSGFGMTPNTITRYGMIKVKKVKDMKFEDLQLADVIVSAKADHMALYTGGKWLVEAYKSGWGPDTIKHRDMARSRFKAYQEDDTAWIMRWPKKTIAG